MLLSSSDSFSSDDESYASDNDKLKKDKNQLLINYTGQEKYLTALCSGMVRKSKGDKYLDTAPAPSPEP